MSRSDTGGSHRWLALARARGCGHLNLRARGCRDPWKEEERASVVPNCWGIREEPDPSLDTGNGTLAVLPAWSDQPRGLVASIRVVLRVAETDLGMLQRVLILP